MYDAELEELIKGALADGILSESEKKVLYKKARQKGIDPDELELVLNARLSEKSGKLGTTKTCPNCGASVQSYQGSCPFCGYAFEDVTANHAIREISDLLRNAYGYDEMEKIIDTYPIPMEKAALLAFITWLRPQCTDANNPLANAYFKRYKECINKVKACFSKDDELKPFIPLYEEDKKTYKRNKAIKKTKDNIGKTWEGTKSGASHLKPLLSNKWFWIILLIVVLALFIIFNKTVRTVAIITGIVILIGIGTHDS